MEHHCIQYCRTIAGLLLRVGLISTVYQQRNQFHLRLYCLSLTVKLPNTGYGLLTLVCACPYPSVGQGQCGKGRGREKESYRVLNCSVVQAEWYFHWWTCGREREERGGRWEGGGREKKRSIFKLQHNKTDRDKQVLQFTRVDRQTDTLTLRGRTLRVLLDPLSHR